MKLLSQKGNPITLSVLYWLWLHFHVPPKHVSLVILTFVWHSFAPPSAVCPRFFVQPPVHLCAIECHKIRCCHSVGILDIIPFCILDSLHFSLPGFKCWIQYCECHFFRGNPSEGNSCFGMLASSIISNRYFFNVLTPLNWVCESCHYVPYEFSKFSGLLCICSSCFLPDMYFCNHHIHVFCSDYCLCYSSFLFILSLVSNNIL